MLLLVAQNISLTGYCHGVGVSDWNVNRLQRRTTNFVRIISNHLQTIQVLI